MIRRVLLPTESPPWSSIFILILDYNLNFTLLYKSHHTLCLPVTFANRFRQVGTRASEKNISKDGYGVQRPLRVWTLIWEAFKLLWFIAFYFSEQLKYVSCINNLCMFMCAKHTDTSFSYLLTYCLLHKTHCLSLTIKLKITSYQVFLVHFHCLW